MTELTGRKAVSHQRILDVAARAIRREGYGGVNVTEVMRAAQLTHGGFYAHFASRDALLAEAVAQAGRDIAAALREQSDRLQARGASPLRAFLEIYLSMDHVRDCDNGCPVSLLSGEMFRQAPEVAEPSRRLIVDMHARVKKVLPAGAPREAAWAVASAVLGAAQLARALAGGDEKAARAVLADTKKDLLARYDSDRKQ
ncbi:MAG TPA: TetR/AcrR family transcriptional regulator [Burkholderiaceae bacterium]